MGRAISWDLYRSLLAVMRAGSLSGAARALRTTQPTIGRHVEALEQALGLALFTRAPDGLTPTAAAVALRPQAEAMEAAESALLRLAHGARDESGGTVRVTASEIMGAEVLPPILAGLREAQPKLVIELVLSNRTDDLLRREADIAVRMVRPAQDALLARRIGSVALGLYAHRDYVARHGAPQTVGDIGRFHVIGFDRDDRSARSVAKGTIDLDADLFSFRSDSDLAQFAALRAGLGIGACQARLAVRHPELEPVLAETLRFELELWLAMHEDQRANPVVRRVFEGLAAGLEAWCRVPASG